MNKVSVIKVKDNVITAVQEAMEKADWKNYLSRDGDISLKVNLGWDLFLPGAVTSCWVVEGVINTIYNYVNKIYIVEAGQVLVDVEKAVRQTRIFELTEKYKKVEWVNLSKMSSSKFKIQSLDLEIEIPEILLKTEIITIPVMKTHGRATISGAIKNQWGCLREVRHNYHPILKELLWEVNKLLPIKFAVMDGTVCLEGNGPKSGIPKVCNLILASSDIVALDVVAAKIMGFDADKIEHINYFRGKVLKRDIEITGEDINKINLNFKRGKNNPVAQGEILLRNSYLKKIVFETKLFYIFCKTAKLYYFVWYYFFGGRKYKNKIIQNTFYGKQWPEEKLK